MVEVVVVPSITKKVIQYQQVHMLSQLERVDKLVDIRTAQIIRVELVVTVLLHFPQQ